MARRRALAGIASMAVLAAMAVAPTGAAYAAKDDPAPAKAKSVDKSDVREVPVGKKYRVAKRAGSAIRQTPSARRTASSDGTPAVGTVRQWLGLDDFNGRLYRKNYTLRGVGDKIEVWVASDSDATSTGTAFPAGDCRNNTPNTTDITDAQVQNLVDQFDTNMFPKESAAFSTPPDRDGSDALIGPDSHGNGGDYSGDGDKIVTLVDNVRDDNFYDFPNAPTYIAGFFSAQFNELFDRNTMTIDAFDWLHRTGATPPNNPTTDPCSSRPGRPFLYEGVFAHEYQHLLQYYTDPAESTWLNEGLSDFAISLVGYADSNATVFNPRAESHLYCFQGFGNVKTASNPNPRDCGGPENSLTRWADQGGAEILADYGNAWSFMLFLYDRYGTDFMSALHRDGDHQGLASVRAELRKFKAGAGVYRVLHDFQGMVLLDKPIGRRDGVLSGRDKHLVTTRSLRSTVNLRNDDSFASPGAPSNGADYVALHGRGAGFLSGKSLRGLRFTGAKTLPTLPLQWTVVSDDPDRKGNPVLWSGNSSNLDSAAITQVSVPASGASLNYLAKYQAETGFDYAYTVVSTDGGATYKALSNANTTDGPLGPAFNGDSGGFTPQAFDLSAYAGKTVLLGFRYVSDGGVNDGGFFVDDVRVGSTTISDGSSLAPFKSPTQFRPTPVENWDVRLIGLNEDTHRAVYREYNGLRSFSLGESAVRTFQRYPVVVAVVGYDDPTEQVQQYAPYTLKANGVIQEGG